MNRLALRIFALSLLWPAVAGAANYTYTFEGLSTGNLAGQDGWFVAHPGLGETTMDVGTGVGFDTSLVTKNPGDGTTDTHRTARVTFNVGDLAGVTNVTLQFDTRILYPNPETPGNFDNFTFFLSDSGDNTVSSSPQLQWGNNGGTPIVAVRQARYQAGNAAVTLPTGSIANGDWVTLRLTMDLYANAGNGVGQLSYANLTQGGGFQSIGPPQPLGMNFTGASNTGAWTSLFMRSDTSAGNLLVDNLFVEYSTTAIPELNGAWIAAGCSLLLSAHFLRGRQRLVPA